MRQVSPLYNGNTMNTIKRIPSLQIYVTPKCIAYDSRGMMYRVKYTSSSSVYTYELIEYIDWNSYRCEATSTWAGTHVEKVLKLHI